MLYDSTYIKFKINPNEPISVISQANFTGKGHSLHKTDLTSRISHKFRVLRTTPRSDQLSANSRFSANALRFHNLLERPMELRRHYFYDYSFIAFMVNLCYQPLLQVSVNTFSHQFPQRLDIDITCLLTTTINHVVRLSSGKNSRQTKTLLSGQTFRVLRSSSSS